MMQKSTYIRNNFDFNKNANVLTDSMIEEILK